MTAFTIPRGQARAVWASLLPHAGRQTEDTPEYGKVRFAPGNSELVAWTLDGATAAATWADVDDHQDDGAQIFDLSTGAIKAALAVFRGPSDPDARQMWNDQLLAVEVLTDTVVLSEVEDVLDGRSLTVERIVIAGEDRYPDVPRLLALIGTDAVVPEARVSADALARFIPSAKAWGGTLLLTVTTDPSRVEVRIGDRLLGLCPALRHDVDEHGVDVKRLSRPWHDRLYPLARPDMPTVVPLTPVMSVNPAAGTKTDLRTGTTTGATS